MLLTLQTPHRDPTLSFRPTYTSAFFSQLLWACRGLCSDDASESQRHEGGQLTSVCCLTTHQLHSASQLFTLIELVTAASQRSQGPHLTLKPCWSAKSMQAGGIKQLSRRRWILYNLTKMGKRKISSCLSQVISCYFYCCDYVLIFQSNRREGGLGVCFFFLSLN